MDKSQVGQIQQITYLRVIKNPTLKQYLHRRSVSETMQQVKGETGTGFDRETNRSIPLSALKAKEMLRGTNAEDLRRLHPSWVEDYRREYGNQDKPA